MTHELPSRRESVTQKLVIHGESGKTSLYISTSHSAEGRLQEAFISVEKTGATERGYVDVISRYVSRELQRGVSLEDALAPCEIKGYPIGAITGYPGLGFCRGYLDCARKYLLKYQEELHAGKDPVSQSR